jgi:hypothetical protein
MNDRIILKGHSKLLKPVITQIMAIHQLIEAKDIGTIYAYHNDLNSIKRVGKPRVNLYFLEDTNFSKKAAPNSRYEGLRRKEGLIRFRLMDETTQSFSRSNATTLANKIKSVFGEGGGYVWSKGKTMYSYSDWELGYQFQLLCKTATEAKRIIASVMSIQAHTPDFKNFNEIKNDQEAIKYPTNPGTQIVMGETISKFQFRPVVDVRFRYAYVRLDGVIKPVNLYSLENKRVSNLVL